MIEHATLKTPLLFMQRRFIIRRYMGCDRKHSPTQNICSSIRSWGKTPQCTKFHEIISKIMAFTLTERRTVTLKSSQKAILNRSV